MKVHKFIWILFLPVFVCNAQFKTNVYSAGIKDPVPGNINPTELNINPNALYKPAEAIIFYDDSLRFLYSYNSDGLLANETRAILIDNNWQEKSRYTYTYSSGYLSEIILKVYVYNNWSNAYRWSYNNDSNGNPLIQLGSYSKSCFNL